MVKIHDVTVPLVPGLVVFPGDPPLLVERIQQAGDAPYGISRLGLTTHSGTHVDAPSHFVAGGATGGAVLWAPTNYASHRWLDGSCSLPTGRAPRNCKPSPSQSPTSSR